MGKTFIDLIQTDSISKIEDQSFSNEIIFERALSDADLQNVNFIKISVYGGNAIFMIVLLKIVNSRIANGVESSFILRGLFIVIFKILS